MRRFVFLGLAYTFALVLTFASEKELAVLKSTADSLDELVSQTKPAYKEVVKPRSKPKKEVVPAVSLQQIAPIVAPQLKLSESEITERLANDRTKLSDLVFARFLEEAVGRPYSALLAEKKTDELLKLIEERQMTARVKTVMDELYTEVSFASLDAMTAKGAPPAGTKGTGKGQKKK